MKKKARCINIDGLEGFIKTYVFKEIRKYLKLKELDFFELKNTTQESLADQLALLEKNCNHLILKENSLISLYRDEIIKGTSLSVLKEKYENMLVQQQKIDHANGGVYFLLMPEQLGQSFNGQKEKIDDLTGVRDCYDFFKNIKNYTIVQGVDIRTIWYDENDKIFDIKDRIINILEKEYN